MGWVASRLDIMSAHRTVAPAHCGPAVQQCEPFRIASCCWLSSSWREDTEGRGAGSKYTRCLVGVSIANAVAGLFIGITHVYFYNMGATSILSLLNFIAPDKPMNVIFAAIAGGIGFALSLGINYFFGVTKEQAEAGVEKATA